MEEELFRPMNSFIVALSPLARIFQPRFHKELMANPDKIFDENPFTICVDKPSGAFYVDFKKPKQIQQPALLNWLTGGPEGDRCRETDFTGIIYAPIQDDMLEALTNLTGLYAENEEKGKKEQDRITKDISKKYGDQMASAKKRSGDRVLRQIRTIHENLQKQYQINKENNVGLYTPSAVEFMCAFVLRTELEDDKAKTARITKEFAKLMEETRVS